MRENAHGSRPVAALLGSLMTGLSFVSPAHAQPTSAALAERYALGHYLEAASEAEQAATADDFAFAARSILALCMTSAAKLDAALVARAQRDAEAALKLAPEHEEGRLQLAIAVSLKSRGMEVMDAWAAGYGDKGRKLAEDVLKADPGNFYAHGFLAVWHLEVERRGGGVGAWMMGASVGAARRHYDQARALAPDDVGVHWQYARALAALDLTGKADEVRAALDRALSAAASDHVERVMQARAQQLSSALHGDRDAAQQLARQML